MPVRRDGGTCSSWAKAQKICFNHNVRRGPPYLRCSGWSPSMPPALSLFNFLMLASISSTMKLSSVMSSKFILDRNSRWGKSFWVSSKLELEPIIFGIERAS